MTDKWFEDWFNSPYYHQLYAHRDTTEAANFIDNLVKYLKPQKDAKLLDVACGKGRHSMQLASYGFDVSGFDLSNESIKEAKEMETEKLHFFVNDIRTPLKLNYFDIAFNFFTSFGYFDNDNDHNNAINAIVKSLKNEGTLILDYLNVTYSERNTIAEHNLTIGSSTYFIRKWNDDTHFYKKIKVIDDKLDEPIAFSEKVRKFTLQDFTEMFKKNGLEITNTFGDYDFGNYDVKNSCRLIVMAKKI